MARPRTKLQEILEETIGNGNVYFQPPETLKMKYPCIRYVRAHISPTFADDLSYIERDEYELTLIYKDPDSDLPRKLARLPLCRHDRAFESDNLHHEVFTIYW